MDKESLKTAREIILEALDNSNIEIIDKTELIINIMQFLNEDKYDENIKILKKENNGWQK